MGFCFLYRECSSSASKNKSLAVSEIVPGTTSPGDINFPVVLKVVNSEARENQSNQSIRRSTCSFTFNRLRQITLILQPFFYLCLVNKFSNHSPGLMRSICCHLKLKERNKPIIYFIRPFYAPNPSESDPVPPCPFVDQRSLPMLPECDVSHKDFGQISAASASRLPTHPASKTLS